LSKKKISKNNLKDIKLHRVLYDYYNHSYHTILDNTEISS